MSKTIESYLGDGVYASINEYGDLVLDLRCQDNTIIVLESEVLNNLLKFLDYAKKQIDGNPMNHLQEKRTLSECLTKKGGVGTAPSIPKPDVVPPGQPSYK